MSRGLNSRSRTCEIKLFRMLLASDFSNKFYTHVFRVEQSYKEIVGVEPLLEPCNMRTTIKVNLCKDCI